MFAKSGFLIGVLAFAVPLSSWGQDAMTFEPVGVADEREQEAEIAEALKAYKRDDFLRASLILYRIAARNEQAISVYEQKAEYTLGKALYRLGLYQASQDYFGRVVEAGSDHRYYRATCKWLYYLSRKISGDPGLLEKISQYDPRDCPTEFRSEIAFLLGHHHYKKAAVQKGLGFLRQVRPESQYFPKAKFLQGISYVRLDQPKPAVESLKDLLRATVDADEVTEDLKYFGQLAVLSMARVFYSTAQFDKAAKYYDRIDFTSPLWLDALFEASWTYFRSRNHEKALGNLHTLNSPFFDEEYVPEAGILEAVIFYSNCNYEKTREAINNFRITYEPLRDEIQGYVQSFSDPTEFYQFLSRLQESGSAVSPQVNQILSAAFRDKTLKRLNGYVRELEREMGLIKNSKSTWARSQLAQSILQDTEVIRSLAVHEAGSLARKRLQRVVNELNELVSQSLKIEFEVASAEKGVLENRLAGAEGIRRDKNTGPVYATDEEHIYWPFNGEYWRDELGYYLYTIKSECGR